jgi:hypothetical protein
MRNTLRRTAAMLVLVGSAVAAAAADGAVSSGRPLYLTFAQEQVIYRGLSKDEGQPTPAGFQPSIGAEIPSSLALRELPSNVTDRIPAARKYEYLKLRDNEVLVVDPNCRQVVDIIAPPI